MNGINPSQIDAQGVIQYRCDNRWVLLFQIPVPEIRGQGLMF